MSLHREVNLEAQICDRLAAAGWLHSDGDAAGYDRARALFPADVVAWVQASQPKAWETLTKNHGAAAEAMLLDRIRKQMDERGTLEVLRRGVEMIGLRAPVALGTVQARAGDECRHSDPLSRQPPARGAAGALFAVQRKQHRPGAVPERPAGGDGGTEDRLHPRHSGRRGPVSL